MRPKKVYRIVTFNPTKCEAISSEQRGQKLKSLLCVKELNFLMMLFPLNVGVQPNFTSIHGIGTLVHRTKYSLIIIVRWQRILFLCVEMSMWRNRNHSPRIVKWVSCKLYFWLTLTIINHHTHVGCLYLGGGYFHQDFFWSSRYLNVDTFNMTSNSVVRQ